MLSQLLTLQAASSSSHIHIAGYFNPTYLG